MIDTYDYIVTKNEKLLVICQKNFLAWGERLCGYTAILLLFVTEINGEKDLRVEERKRKTVKWKKKKLDKTIGLRRWRRRKGCFVVWAH